MRVHFNETKINILAVRLCSIFIQTAAVNQSQGLFGSSGSFHFLTVYTLLMLKDAAFTSSSLPLSLWLTVATV